MGEVMYVLTVVFMALGVAINPLAGSRTETVNHIVVDKSSQFNFKTNCDEAQAALSQQNIPGLLRVVGWCTYVR